MNQIIYDFRLGFDCLNSWLTKKGLVKRRYPYLWSYRTKNNIRFTLRNSVWDSIAVSEVWWLNEYLRSLPPLKNIRTVIDIGGHIGTFSVFMANKYPKAKVFTYEPDQDNFKLLQKNIRDNKLTDRISSYNLAVAGEGEHGINLVKDNNNLGMHRRAETTNNNISKNKVKAISLAEIFTRNHLLTCDFLKVDCEGSEYAILFSTPEKILRKIRYLALEYHKGGDYRKLKHYLESIGFHASFDRKCLFKAPLIVAWRS